jgi:hypothetical protein
MQKQNINKSNPGMNQSVLNYQDQDLKKMIVDLLFTLVILMVPGYTTFIDLDPVIAKSALSAGKIGKSVRRYRFQTELRNTLPVDTQNDDFRFIMF